MSAKSLYRIQALPDGGKFRLFNYGAPCGPRLIKGDPFPFATERWWLLDSQAKADVAAEQLQQYLDKYEAGELS